MRIIHSSPDYTVGRENIRIPNISFGGYTRPIRVARFFMLLRELNADAYITHIDHDSLDLPATETKPTTNLRYWDRPASRSDPSSEKIHEIDIIPGPPYRAESFLTFWQESNVGIPRAPDRLVIKRQQTYIDLPIFGSTRERIPYPLDDQPKLALLGTIMRECVELLS